MALVVDTGPLYAALDTDDPAYQSCWNLLDSTTETIVIPAPVLVEVDYWIHRYLDVEVAIGLIENVQSGALEVVDLIDNDYSRIAQIIRTYADAKIGFVDAAVLAIVERLNEPKLVTLDRRHFGMMRPRHVDALQLLPEL